MPRLSTEGLCSGTKGTERSEPGDLTGWSAITSNPWFVDTGICVIHYVTKCRTIDKNLRGSERAVVPSTARFTISTITALMGKYFCESAEKKRHIERWSAFIGTILSLGTPRMAESSSTTYSALTYNQESIVNIRMEVCIPLSSTFVLYCAHIH